MNEDAPSLYSHPQFYDLVEGAYATGNVLEFYCRQIARYGEPVLELACGSGRLTIPLAEAGIQITGLGLSEAMLTRAVAKAAERGVHLPLVHGDIRSFQFSQAFNFIFLPAQSLTHLHTRKEVEACFFCVQQHLSGGWKIRD
jgi:2-polyprenyl-3-methyl-5-hydroxy-6-metoxy-1,4-benzoquinol methylase